MAEVAITIAGRIYRLACDDGEEERLGELGRALEERITTLRGALGEVGDMRLVVMAGITLIDEAQDLVRENERLQTEMAGGHDSQRAQVEQLAATEKVHAERIAAAEQAHAEQMAAVERAQAERLAASEEAHAERVAAAEERLAAAEKAAATREGAVAAMIGEVADRLESLAREIAEESNGA
jgi:cell division protein ZapA